ncbi:MAG: hypothetical protein AB7U81_11615 [Thiohalomonadaceae bacterium]
MITTTAHRILVTLVLAAAMALTRSHHFADLVHLPDASWAVFFLAGFYLASGRAFAALLALAVISDFAAITFGGVSDFCISPAYGFLVPAYGMLFLAGRWYGGRYRLTLATLSALLVSVFSGTLACELLSSGGFFFFSGRFADPGWSEFGHRLALYFPGALESVMLYLGMAMLVHVTLTMSAKRRRVREAA